ncbi:hypothetical protein AMK09_33885 [Streptomyces sp. CB02488]|nr:hypothetical protein AMK09_33885 [Streptomyces sp. CB02488]
MDPLIEHACLATPTAYALMAEYGTSLVPTQYAQTYFLERLDDEDLWEDQPPKMRGAYRRFGEDLREGLRRPAEAEAKIAFGRDAEMFPYTESRREFPTLVADGLSPTSCRAVTPCPRERGSVPLFEAGYERGRAPALAFCGLSIMTRPEAVLAARSGAGSGSQPPSCPHRWASSPGGPRAA